MLRFFNTPWRDVPTVWIDVETTGTLPGVDRAVQVGIARFEGGKCVVAGSWPVNPGIPIPPEATAIHGITDAMVSGEITIAQVFAGAPARAMLDGAQPGAYNAPFDQRFVPVIGDWTWPWLDALTLVRVFDRYARGKGRHRLEVAAERHGIVLANAHDAMADATAAGELFYKLAPLRYGPTEDRPRVLVLGEALRTQQMDEAEERYRFLDWLSRQPPRETEDCQQ